jgi:hypothetical protein
MLEGLVVGTVAGNVVGKSAAEIAFATKINIAVKTKHRDAVCIMTPIRLARRV